MQTLVRPGQALTSLKSFPGLQPLRIVALGDSLIYGYGDPEGGGWVERLRRGWMEPESPGHTLYNLGVRGDGAEQVRQRLAAEFRSRGELRNRLPDRILLSVGVNDSARLSKLQGRNFTEFRQFEITLVELLDEAQALCPVWFVGMIPVDPTKMPFLDCLYYNHFDQYRYKEATRQACEVREIPYLDLFDRWISKGDRWWQARLGPDGLHPNVLGYQTILQEVEDWQPIRQL